ncbi:MAG: signal peptidase I [Lachnospiraceae bacterium]
MKKKKSLLKEIISFSLYLVLVLVITVGIVQFVGQRTVVVGHSMENTLQDGDNLIVDKISYRFQEPKRFDIIVFPYQYEENTYYIKRIIGLPGDKVRIDKKGDIYINGQILNENYGKEVIENQGMAAEELILGKEDYFVLGDNRNESEDSRFEDVGFIHQKDIIGKAWLRVYPFNSFGLVQHK